MEGRMTGTTTQPFNDAWTQAESTRPGWLLEMRTTVGLIPEAEAWIAPKWGS